MKFPHLLLRLVKMRSVTKFDGHFVIDFFGIGFVFRFVGLVSAVRSGQKADANPNDPLIKLADIAGLRCFGHSNRPREQLAQRRIRARMRLPSQVRGFR